MTRFIIILTLCLCLVACEIPFVGGGDSAAYPVEEAPVETGGAAVITQAEEAAPAAGLAMTNGSGEFTLKDLSNPSPGPGFNYQANYGTNWLAITNSSGVAFDEAKLEGLSGGIPKVAALQLTICNNVTCQQIQNANTNLPAGTSTIPTFYLNTDAELSTQITEFSSWAFSNAPDMSGVIVKIE